MHKNRLRKLYFLSIDKYLMRDLYYTYNLDINVSQKRN